MGLSQIQKPRNSDILTKQERERERVLQENVLKTSKNNQHSSTAQKFKLQTYSVSGAKKKSNLEHDRKKEKSNKRLKQIL